MCLSASEVALTEAKSVNFQSFRFVFKPHSSNQLHGQQDVGGLQESCGVGMKKHTFSPIFPPQLTSWRGLTFSILALEQRFSNLAIHLYYLGSVKKCRSSVTMPGPIKSEFLRMGLGSLYSL